MSFEFFPFLFNSKDLIDNVVIKIPIDLDFLFSQIPEFSTISQPRSGQLGDNPSFSKILKKVFEFCLQIYNKFSLQRCLSLMKEQFQFYSQKLFMRNFFKTIWAMFIPLAQILFYWSARNYYQVNWPFVMYSVWNTFYFC